MELLSPKIKEYLPDWNKRIYTEADAFEFCAANKIIAIETDLIDDLGEYRIHKQRPFIFLNKFVEARCRSWILLHEIGHFILHPTTAARFSDQVTRRKIERQANFVAAVALLPKHILETKTITEITDEYGYPRKVILIRKEIYDHQKI